MNHLMRIASIVLVTSIIVAMTPPTAKGAEPAFKLAPAVAVEAEDFTIDRGFHVVKLGQGNYATDIIGFSHTGGERFLSADAGDVTAAAHKDIAVPIAGPYRLWVRYEYMPFTESRFKITIEQDGKVVAQKEVGAKDNPRYAFGETTARPQYDPPWGNEGLVEEVIDVPALAAGPARLVMTTVAQPQAPGRTANRNIDLLYLTSDVKEAWRDYYGKITQYYPILDAFRDTYGPRYEVRFTNKGDKPLTIATLHYYNRNQFYQRDDVVAVAKDLAPGAASAWLPMPMQDTTHFGMAQFTPSAPQAFTTEIRVIGGAIEVTVDSTGDSARVYLPPYPGHGDKAINLISELDATLKLLKETKAPGKVPTRPLCYGGWSMPIDDTEYSRKYSQLYGAMGMRSFLGVPTPQKIKELAAAGVPLTKSVAYGEYRFPPTAENIATAKTAIEKACGLDKMRWFDFGDEIGFSEWVSYMVADKRVATNNKDIKVEEVVRPLWRDWLAKQRPGFKPEDYWRGAWGALDAAQLRPDSSAEAAAEKPRLYVDSVLFYEDAAIAYIAAGNKAIKAALGPDVLCGANYSGYPFYYPHTTPYIKWFRDGAADFGRHSEYFWQLGQVTPMINGYFAEHFRAGMRFNPKAIIKQYTMPHSPGNTDASFRRTAFTHLAHGVKNLDFFGIGMNETFTENYIDHRDHERFRAIRDITHSMALVEDVIEESQVTPSQVAMLISDSTEKWDWSKVAKDFASSGWTESDSAFRKVRLSYHQERVGIWTALSFAGSSPDLLIERDLNAEVLKGYKVLYLVGDCLPASATPALEAWVKGGGVLFATAGVGRFGMYHEPNPELQKLLGIESRVLDERDTFIRTSQELPFLKPLGFVALSRKMDDQFPVLAIQEQIKPMGDAKTLVPFSDGSPAVISRESGKGKIYYTASLPGLAYLHTGLTKPQIWVPDRGDGAHRAVTTYDKAAANLILSPLAAASITPQVRTTPDYIDTRLIQGTGVFFLPLANYNDAVGQKVVLTISPPAGAATPVRAISAFCGTIDLKVEDGKWIVTIPTVGAGDVVRIEVK